MVSKHLPNTKGIKWHFPYWEAIIFHNSPLSDHLLLKLDLVYVSLQSPTCSGLDNMIIQMCLSFVNSCSEGKQSQLENMQEKGLFFHHALFLS